MKKIKWLVIAVLVFAGGVSCMQASNSLTDGEVVEKKTVAWLQAMVDGKWDETYQFTSPGYRSGVTEMEHILKMASRRIRWMGGEVLGSECDEDACSVDVRVVYTVHAPVRGIKDFESFDLVHENWLKLDGKWWIVPGK